jgi:hypothetical protein
MLHVNPYHIANVTVSRSILVELWDLKTSSSSSSGSSSTFLFITYEFLEALLFIALHM